MNKTISIKKKPTLKIFLILLGALVLIIAGYFASIPLFNNLEKDRFLKLGDQIQTIFQKIEVASNGTEKWEYETSCRAELAGDWLTGEYFCTAQILMDKTITSVDELSGLQAKYYPIINTDTSLTQVTDLDPQLPNDFGKNFVVSSAEKNYKNTETNTPCTYLIKLYQNSEDTSLTSDSYGLKIYNDTGNARISLTCTEKADGNWYSNKK